MKEIQVKIRSFQDARDLTALAADMDCEVLITDGKRTVNAKSILCIFGLNLLRPLHLQLACSDEDFERFRGSAARFEISSK